MSGKTTGVLGMREMMREGLHYITLLLREVLLSRHSFI